MQPLEFTPEDPDDDLLAKLRAEKDNLEQEIAARASHVVGTGVSQHVGGEQLVKISERYDREYQWAVKAQRHLWVATVAYVLTDDAIRDMHTEPLHLDTENLLSEPALGCFVCEEPYTPQLRLRKCPGEPS